MFELLGVLLGLGDGSRREPEPERVRCNTCGRYFDSVWLHHVCPHCNTGTLYPE